MDFRALGIALVVVVLVWTAAQAATRGILTSRLERYFQAGEFDHCLKILDSPTARFALPAYNREFMRLSALELIMDAEAEDKAIQGMLRMRCTPQQRLALLARAFDFYAGQDDRERAAHILELIESAGDKELLKDCRQKFGIVFDKKWSHITEMERRLPKASPAEQVRLCYLLALQYENKGDKARSNEDLKRAGGESA